MPKKVVFSDLGPNNLHWFQHFASTIGIIKSVMWIEENKFHICLLHAAKLIKKLNCYLFICFMLWQSHSQTVIILQQMCGEAWRVLRSDILIGLFKKMCATFYDVIEDNNFVINVISLSMATCWEIVKQNKLLSKYVCLACCNLLWDYWMQCSTCINVCLPVCGSYPWVCWTKQHVIPMFFSFLWQLATRLLKKTCLSCFCGNLVGFFPT